MSKEATLHQQVCDYLRLQHRGAIFHTDFAAGTKMTMGQAVRNKRLQSSRAWPDLFVAEPRHGFHGLFIELKVEGTRLYLRSGEMTTNPHVQEQADMLDALMARGYSAHFAVGFEQAKEIIDAYLNGGEDTRVGIAASIQYRGLYGTYPV